MTYIDQVAQSLNEAIELMSREAIADKFDIDVRTLKKWEDGNIRNPGLLDHALQSLYRTNGHHPQNDDSSGFQFRFIDLFAGIGGTRQGLESIGGKCVFTCEIDKYCVKTYKENFITDHAIVGDIKEVHESDVPDHDVLVAGVPLSTFFLLRAYPKRIR